MTKSKRQVSFWVETELWKNFSKKCIDANKTKTEIFIELISKFMKGK